MHQLHPGHLIADLWRTIIVVVATVRIKTEDGHETEVMDVADLADLQRRVIIWLLGIVATLVILSATGTAFWLNEHFDQRTLQSRVENIDSTGTKYGLRVLEAMRERNGQAEMRDTLLTLKLQQLIDGQRIMIKRLDRVERLLKLPALDNSSNSILGCGGSGSRY